jgi:hypothetical protein
MRFEEFRNVSDDVISERAKNLFEAIQEGGPLYNTDLGRAALLEAQFYMQELDRRERERERQADEANAARDFKYERIIIYMIAGEIVLAIVSLIYTAHEGIAQNRILANLQTSIQVTADQLKEQLAIQYRMFVSASYDQSRRQITLFNSSKTEAWVWGFAFGLEHPVMIHGGPTSIPAMLILSISIQDYNPKIFDGVRQSPPSILPVVVYLKNAKDDEYVWNGKLSVQNLNDLMGGTLDGSLQQQKWSQRVTLSRVP